MFYPKKSGFDDKIALWFLVYSNRLVHTSEKVASPVGQWPWNIFRELLYQYDRMTMVAGLRLLRSYLRWELLARDHKLSIENYVRLRRKLHYFEMIEVALGRLQSLCCDQVVLLKIERNAELAARLVSRYKDKFTALDNPVENFFIESGRLISEAELWDKRTTAYNYIF